MKKVPIIDHGKELRILRKIIQWAKEMGASEVVLQDLKEIEEDSDLVHRILSGGRNEKFQHMILYMRPLCEAEHVNRTISLYKSEHLTNKSEEIHNKERLKAVEYIDAYFVAKQKKEKVKQMKRKLKALELNVDGIQRTIEMNCCYNEKLTDEVRDLTKKTVMLDLKVKSMIKQVEEWDLITEELKYFNLANSVPRNPKLTPETEALVRSWVNRHMDITKSSLSPDIYQTGRDAEVMLDDLINDLMLPKVRIPSKDTMMALVKIVIESRKTMIKSMEENIYDDSFDDYRKGKENHLKSLMLFQCESDDEINDLRQSVYEYELELMSLHTEVAEELINHVQGDRAGEHDPQEMREVVEDYLERLIQVKRLREVKAFMKENVAVLEEEAAARSTRNDSFHSYVMNRRDAFNLMSKLQDDLKSQGTKVTKLVEENLKSSLMACKQVEYDHTKIDFETVFMDVLEKFLHTPINVMTRAYESDNNVFSNEEKINLVRTSEVVRGPDHVTINKILNLLAQYKKLVSFSLPTMETKILSLIDSRIKELEVKRDEFDETVVKKKEKMITIVSETDTIQDETGVILVDWKELPFYDCIPDCLTVDGRDFIEWQNLDDAM